MPSSKTATHRKGILLIVLLLLIFSAAGTFLWREKKQQRYNDLIHAACQRHKVPYSLIKAIIRRESNFNSNALGAAGEFGLMQVMPIAAKEWVQDLKKTPLLSDRVLLDPELNIEVGTWYFAKKYHNWKEYKHGEVLALASYNAGRSRLIKLNWIPKDKQAPVLPLITFRDTKKYIEKILSFRKKYLKEELSYESH